MERLRHATVSCERCGHRQPIERGFSRPETFFVVCHYCEGVLRVEISATDLRSRSVARQRLHAA